MSRKTKKQPPDNCGGEETAISPAAQPCNSSAGTPCSAGREDAPPAVSFRPGNWLFAAALVVVVFLVYQPAWQGGLLWDDDYHVPRPELRSWHGLYRIWFDIGATEQYYPLIWSAFWVEHKLWGDAMLGYHLVTIFLHAMAALLVALILRRLAIPGAWLAAAIFALHPVQVESVAWITELKNTLSGVCYLAAMDFYLRFERTRKTSYYLGALALFLLALLSKTVIASLPAALLVVFWWQRGRLSWKKDALPLVPFFLMGAAAGLFTAYFESAIVGAHGIKFKLSLVQRCLIAGRAIWFYLGKLFWPTNLSFVYPRWRIDAGVWWQYLFPLAAVALLLVLFTLRRRTRAPLAAALFFVGTLLPALGFLNVFPFIYSFVFDHFQYLASLGIITLSSAGAALLWKRAGGRWRLIGQMGGVALVAVLAVLSWRQSRMYADIETLYRTTIDKDPDCWLARNNLGIIMFERGQVVEAIAQYRRCLEINPDYAESHSNLGTALASRGQVDEALAEYQRALEINPDDAVSYYNLGRTFAGLGQVTAAIGHYRKALEIRPDYADAHNNLGSVLALTGQVDEAITHYQRALEIKPACAEAHNNLGLALAGCGQVDAAVAHFQTALEIKPDYTEAHNNLGTALASRGQAATAFDHFQKALSLASARNDKALADRIRARMRLLQPVTPAGKAP